MPLIIETPREFDARHTTDGKPKITDGERELFPDGAIRLRTGVMVEPPLEPAALLRAKRNYVAVKLQSEERAWNAFKADCTQRFADRATYGSSCPMPAHDYKEQLQRGAERITKLREELAVFDRAIAELPSERARNIAAEQQRKNQSSVQHQLSEIAGMQI